MVLAILKAMAWVSHAFFLLPQIVLILCECRKISWDFLPKSPPCTKGSNSPKLLLRIALSLTWVHVFTSPMDSVFQEQEMRCFSET